jgi:DNA repair exonuclease SbcCD ATPase subunit
LVAVTIEPKGAVTPISGKNGAGKTSVIDAIAAGLGGGTQSPELPIRKGQERAVVVLDLDDLVVTRKWTAKGSTLEVTTKDGASYKSPQAVLDKLLGQLSFDPLAFGRMKDTEQTATLAKVAGVDLEGHRTARQKVFDERTAANKQAKDIKAQLAGIPEPAADLPEREISVAEILDELKRADESSRTYERLKADKKKHDTEITIIQRSIAELEQQLVEYKQELATSEKNAQEAALRLANCPQPTDPDPIRARGREAEEINKRVRARDEREATQRVAAAREDYAKGLTAEIEKLDQDLARQLAAAALPIPGLTLDVENGVLLAGVPFSQCSGAERLRASVAIGLALNPKLKLMLIRDGSLLDDEGMKLLAELAEAAGAQILIERVSNGDGVGVRIVDGSVEEATAAA